MKATQTADGVHVEHTPVIPATEQLMNDHDWDSKHGATAHAESSKRWKLTEKGYGLV